MKTLLLFVALLLLPASVLAADDAAEVRAVFADFKSALTARDGAAAARLLSKESLSYYEALRQSALGASSQALRALPPADRLSVYWIRYHLPKEQLQKSSAAQLFALLVERGSLGGPHAESASLGPVQVQGASARAQSLHNGEVVPLIFHFFRREPGGWRVDILSQARQINKSLDQELRERGSSAERLFEETLGRKLDQAEWQKLLSED